MGAKVSNEIIDTVRKSPCGTYHLLCMMYTSKISDYYYYPWWRASRETEIKLAMDTITRWHRNRELCE